MNKKKIIGGIVGIIVLILIIGGAYWLYNRESTVTTSTGEEVKISAEDRRDLKALRKLYELPDDVVPIMARVTDPDALRAEQPGFFEKAQAGDRVAVFKDMAILYDPKEPIIRHVGAVDFDENAGKVSFAVYNGSTVNDAEKAFAQTIAGTFKDAVVTSGAKAITTYPKTLVIDLVGNNTEIQRIAQALGGQVSALPAGEKAPENAVVLVIVGQDYADALNGQ
mgnify:CR=1 FL=1